MNLGLEYHPKKNKKKPKKTQKTKKRTSRYTKIGKLASFFWFFFGFFWFFWGEHPRPNRSHKFRIRMIISIPGSDFAQQAAAQSKS